VHLLQNFFLYVYIKMSENLNKSLLLVGIAAVVGYLIYLIVSKKSEGYTAYKAINDYKPITGTVAGGLTAYYPNCEGSVDGKYMEYPSFTTGAPFQASALARYPIANPVVQLNGAPEGTVLTVAAPGTVHPSIEKQQKVTLVGGSNPDRRVLEHYNKPMESAFYSTTRNASTDIPARSGLQSQAAMGKAFLTGREPFIANTEDPKKDYGCGRTPSLTDEKRARLEQFSTKENFEAKDLDAVIQAQSESEMDAGFGPYVAQSVNYTTALAKDKYSRFTDMIRGDIPIVTRNVPWEFQTQVPDVDRTLSNPGYINSTTGHGCPPSTIDESSIIAETQQLLNPQIPSIAQQYTPSAAGGNGARRLDTVVAVGPSRSM
jgi:hypothetical protein